MNRHDNNALVLVGLHPTFRSMVEPWLGECEHRNLPIWLVEGLRSASRQLELFRHGRAQKNDGTWYITNRKLVLTNAMSAKDGAHPRGGAIDFCPMIGGVLVWKREDLFNSAGMLGEEHGMRWGGNFRGRNAKALGDLDHLEDPLWRDLPLPAALPVS
jgi:peptidoglycan L-alanyl-D-glutamate endopeptidase CwlK